MRSVQEISDPEMLRQVAVLLERENAKLHAKVYAKLYALVEELARLRGDRLPTPQHELAFLKELLAQRDAHSSARPRSSGRAERTRSPRHHRRPAGVMARPRSPGCRS